MLSFVTALTVVSFFLYFPEMWMKLMIGVAVGALVVFRLTRPLRKRAKFCRGLKKMCRTKKYRLTRVRNFFQSLFWSGNREDFILDTGSYVYYVRYLTVRKYRSTVYLEQPEEIRLVTKPLNNKFTTILDIQPRVKHYPLDFSIDERKVSLLGNKKLVKAVILNPVCEEIRYKKHDGGYETTGNGGFHCGFTVFTGSGFLETVRRNEGQPKQTASH